MRVLFVNKSNFRGGAAAAAERIKCSLETFYSVDCYFISALSDKKDEKRDS